MMIRQIGLFLLVLTIFSSISMGCRDDKSANNAAHEMGEASDMDAPPPADEEMNEEMPEEYTEPSDE